MEKYTDIEHIWIHSIPATINTTAWSNVKLLLSIYIFPSASNESNVAGDFDSS